MEFVCDKNLAPALSEQPAGKRDQLLGDELRELLADVRRGPSIFAIDRFITVKHGITPWGMYVQALRELDGRVRGLRECYIELKILCIKAKMAKSDSYLNENIDKRALAALEAQKLELQHEYLERETHRAEREAWRFMQQARTLKEELGELTPERVESLERDFRYHDIKRRIALDLAAPPYAVGRKTKESLCALPPPIRVRLLTEMSDPTLCKEMIAWLHTHEPSTISKRCAPSHEDLRRAITNVDD